MANYKKIAIKLGGKKITIRKGLFTAKCKKAGFSGVNCACIKHYLAVAKKNNDKKLLGQIAIAKLGLKRKGVKC